MPQPWPSATMIPERAFRKRRQGLSDGESDLVAVLESSLRQWAAA
jgi:hypothetical protein